MRRLSFLQCALPLPITPYRQRDHGRWLAARVDFTVRLPRRLRRAGCLAIQAFFQLGAQDFYFLAEQRDVRPWQPMNLDTPARQVFPA